MTEHAAGQGPDESGMGRLVNHESTSAPPTSGTWERGDPNLCPCPACVDTRAVNREIAKSDAIMALHKIALPDSKPDAETEAAS